MAGGIKLPLLILFGNIGMTPIPDPRLAPAAPAERAGIIELLLIFSFALLPTPIPAMDRLGLTLNIVFPFVVSP